MSGDDERGFPSHVLDAAFGPDTHPRWLAGLIARYGQPVTYQPKPIRLGACRYQTWAWVGLGVQVEQTLSAFTVSAHRKGRMARLAGLERYPTDAQISGVVALAGLDDAPEVAPAPNANQTERAVDLSDLYCALDSASTVMALSSQDWSVAGDFAWLYGIFCGWNDGSLEDGDATDTIAARFRWDADKVARLRRLRAAVAAFDINVVGDLQRTPRRTS